MRLLGSIVLLTGALSVGAYAYLPVISFNHHNLSKLVRIQTPAGAGSVDLGRVERPAERGKSSVERTFSPTSPLFAEALGDRRSRTAMQTSEGGGAAWRAVVAAHDDAGRGATQANDYAASVELARELQRELKRVGCYEGDADGDWKAASRRAMGAFLSKVNATLPVERPDYILLTLLQGHADRACDLSCPTGQGVSSDGRCIPNVIVAQPGTAPPAASLAQTAGLPAAISPWTAKVAPVVSAAAPRAHQRDKRQIGEASAVAIAPPPAPAKPSVVAATDPAARAPAVDVSGSSAAGSLVAREPLPGRMAVGAAVREIEPKAEASVMEAPAGGQVRAQTRAAYLAPEAQESKPADRPRARAPNVSVRKEPGEVRRADARSYSGPMVRTSQGKVRRGSPQHNLMLSLGGVF